MPNKPSRSSSLSTDRSTPLLRQRIRALSHHLPKALAGEEEPIHQMRVTARRLRVALPLLARKPGGRRVRRAQAILRSLTRAGGGSRDLDVSVALLQEHRQGLDTVSPELKLLIRRIRAARARSRQRMAEDLLDLPISRLRRHLDAVLARRGEGVFTVLVRLREFVEGGRGDLLAMLDKLGESFDPAPLHKLRMRARRLRYAAEVMDLLREQPTEAAALFKQMQERLGHIHDAYVLSAWLGRQAAVAETRGQGPLAAEARLQEAHFLQASRLHHAEFLELRPRELLMRAFDAMSPARSAA